MDIDGYFDAFRALADRRGRVGALLGDKLAATRTDASDGPGTWAAAVARSCGLPAAAGLGPATHYADLAVPHGRRHVRVGAGTALPH